MRYQFLSAAAAAVACVFTASAQVLPGAPETNGVTPKTATAYVNGANTVNNLGTESLSIDLAGNGNLIVGWEDDGSDINSLLGVWTLLDPNGVMITPQTVMTNRDVTGDLAIFEATTNQFLSFFRSDNTATPGFPGGWGPKVRANRFGNGIGMGTMAWAIGLEIPELLAINEDAGGPPPASDDFPIVQLLNNDGTPLRLGPISGVTNLGIVTLADADVQPAGSIRIGGWDYLSSGNILVVGESRQADDRALTGQTGGNIPVYRIVTPSGIQVKEYSAASSTPDGGNIRNNGAAVTASGFALRWEGVGGANVRLFDNSGAPLSTNMALTDLTGHAQAAGGGNGNDHGINSNGKDAYVISSSYNVDGTNGVWVTVLNADGSVRWSRDVADDLVLFSVGGTSAALDEDGGAIVVFNATPDAGLSSTIMGRRFDSLGNPVGGSFYVSETEVPDVSAPPLASDNPKVAWRNGKIAIGWLSRNNPEPGLTGTRVIAYRLFVSSGLPGAPEENGLIPKTSTAYINGTNGVNNLNTEALGVGIANNGNVLVAWEDDGDGIDDIEAVWTMFDANGNWITPNTKIDSIAGGISVTNRYLSFFRPNGSATPGYVSWGPRVHANLFGAGIGHGANADADLLGGEVASYAGWAGSGNFPAVQLFDNQGTPQSDILAGVSQAYGAPADGIRIGDWEYLSNGNIVIVGDSRQNADFVNLYGGATPGNHSIFRILTPAGTVVKAETLVSATPLNGNIWHGVGSTMNGFAVRFDAGGAKIRMFDNAGNPTTSNLVLSALTGHPQASGGGRGDGVGFHGNGKDAYVVANDYNIGGFAGFWVTVINTNGTVRWTRDVSDDLSLVAGGVGRGDAAINEAGEVLVVFDARITGYGNNRVTLGRRFDAMGTPMGGTFYVSEKEVPNFETPPPSAERPRVAWRNGQAAIVWQSGSYPDALIAPVVAQRYFLTGPPSLSISRSGNVLTLSWPTGLVGYTLLSSGTLGTGAAWTPVTGVINNSLSVTNPTGAHFYRLRQ